MIFEEAHYRDETGWKHIDGELVLPHSKLLDKLGEAGENILPVFVQAFCFVLILVGRIDNRCS